MLDKRPTKIQFQYFFLFVPLKKTNNDIYVKTIIYAIIKMHTNAPPAAAVRGLLVLVFAYLYHL